MRHWHAHTMNSFNQFFFAIVEACEAEEREFAPLASGSAFKAASSSAHWRTSASIFFKRASLSTSIFA